jgi:protein TonB
MPDELPRITNAELPFRYPLPQYARQLQGNVLLRLYVEADGHVVTDSTRLLQSSGDAAFDSAALAGAKALQFQPARRRGTPIPVSLLFPVHVRHPDARAFPGDTL